ncbi:MAG TPA: hypothetical protein VFA37_01350 [Gaiellaceae bacterium]|nr:hypothetical protein [Gaiellaceae bacterium]
MAVRIQTYAQPRRSNPRAWLAAVCGLVAAAILPVAIELTRKIPGAALLDAVWAIPVAALAAVAALMFERGARGVMARTLDQAGGARLVRLGRVLAVTGICFTLSSSIAVGLYELLLRLEH